jgi:hypothetical protein
MYCVLDPSRPKKNVLSQFRSAAARPSRLVTEYRNWALAASAMKPPRTAVSGINSTTAARIVPTDIPPDLSPSLSPQFGHEPLNNDENHWLHVLSDAVAPCPRQIRTVITRMIMRSITDIHAPAVAAFSVGEVSSAIMYSSEKRI